MGRAELWPIGRDYAWLASDQRGRVAIFTNAGQGPIPIVVLADRHFSDRAEALVRGLPERTILGYASPLPHPEEFIAFARRGLFAYDWQDCHRSSGRSHRYEMLASPAVPVGIEQLEDEVAALFGKARFRSLRFADSLSIAVDEHVEIRRT